MSKNNGNHENTLKFNRVAALALARAVGLEVIAEQGGGYILVIGETHFTVTNLQAIVTIATGILNNQERVAALREHIVGRMGAEKASEILNPLVETDEGNVETYLESLSKNQPQPPFHGRPAGSKNKTPAA